MSQSNDETEYTTDGGEWQVSSSTCYAPRALLLKHPLRRGLQTPAQAHNRGFTRYARSHTATVST